MFETKADGDFASQEQFQMVVDQCQKLKEAGNMKAAEFILHKFLGREDTLLARKGKHFSENEIREMFDNAEAQSVIKSGDL